MPLDFNIYTPELNKKPEVIVPENINNSLFLENPNKSIEDILNTPGFIENVWAKTMREQTSFTTNENRINDLKKFNRDDLYYGQDMDILEAQYEQNQSFTEKVKNTTLGAGLIASKSFLQTWESTFNSIANIFNDDPTYKSDATKALVETMEDINNRFPIYKKLDNSFLNKASNTIWETLPQIGFTLGTGAAMFTMSAPLAFIAPETGGASLAVLAEEAFIGLNALKNGLIALRTLNGVRTTLNGIKALQVASPLIRLGAMNLISSNAEANVEAYSNYKDLKKDFLKQGMSYEEAETRANNSAMDVKSYNQKLLALTNITELIPFSQPLSKLANKMSIFKLGTKLVGDNIDNLTMEVVNNSFIKKAVNRLVIGSVPESFEELAQGAGQKIIGDFYKKQLDPNVRMTGSQILGDVISEIGQRVTTEEGIKEMASGFIIGGVTQGGGTAVRNTANAIGGLPQTIFGGKSESQELQEKADSFNEALKDINNKVKISPLFNSFYEKAKANVINNINIINSLSDENQDMFNAKSAEEANKAELFKHLHSTGLGESFWEKLDEVNKLTPEEFKKFFNTQGEIDIDTFKKVSRNLQTQYNNYAKIADNIDTIYNNKIQSNIRKMAKNNMDENEIKNYAYSYHQAKYLLADSLHMGNSAKIRFSQLSDEIRNKTNQSSLTSLFVELINNPQNVISDLKSKIEISEDTIKNTSDNNLKESAEQELNKSKEQLDFINNNLIGKPEKIISFLGDNVKFQKLAELYNFNNPETLSSAKDIIDLIKIQDLIKTSENTYKFYSKEDTFFKVMNLYKTLEEQKENLTEKVNNDFEINKIKSKIEKILTPQEIIKNQPLLLNASKNKSKVKEIFEKLNPNLIINIDNNGNIEVLEKNKDTSVISYNNIYDNFQLIFNSFYNNNLSEDKFITELQKLEFSDSLILDLLIFKEDKNKITFEDYLKYHLLKIENSNTTINDLNKKINEKLKEIKLLNKSVQDNISKIKILNKPSSKQKKEANKKLLEDLQKTVTNLNQQLFDLKLDLKLTINYKNELLRKLTLIDSLKNKLKNKSLKDIKIELKSENDNIKSNNDKIISNLQKQKDDLLKQNKKLESNINVLKNLLFNLKNVIEKIKKLIFEYIEDIETGNLLITNKEFFTNLKKNFRKIKNNLEEYENFLFLEKVLKKLEYKLNNNLDSLELKQNEYDIIENKYLNLLNILENNNIEINNINKKLNNIQNNNNDNYDFNLDLLNLIEEIESQVKPFNFGKLRKEIKDESDAILQKSDDLFLNLLLIDNKEEFLNKFEKLTEDKFIPKKDVLEKLKTHFDNLNVINEIDVEKINYLYYFNNIKLYIINMSDFYLNKNYENEKNKIIESDILNNNEKKELLSILNKKFNSIKNKNNIDNNQKKLLDELNKISSEINWENLSNFNLNSSIISENQEVLIKESLSEKEINILTDYLINKQKDNLSILEKKLLNIFKENVDSRKIENQNRFDNFKDKFKQSEEFIENKISEINKVNIEKENIHNLIKNLLKLKTILNEIKSDFENIKDIKNLFDFENIELKIQILETTINNTLDKLNEQKEKYKINLKKLSNLIEDDSLNNDLKNITVADELLTLKEKAEKILAKFPNVVNPIKFDIFSSITQEIKKFKSNIKKIFDYDDQNKIKNERIEDYNFTDGVANIVKEDNYIDEDGVVIDVSDGIVIRHNLNGKTVDFKIERFDNITDSIIDKIVSDQINIDNDTSPDIKSINLKYKALEYKLILLVLNGKINIFDKDAYLEQYVKELKYKTRKINELRELAKNKKSGDILSNIVSISEPSEGFIGLVVYSIKDVFEFLKTTDNFKDFNEDDLKFNFDTAEGQYIIIINHKSPEKLNTSIKIKPKQISTIKFNNLSYEEVLKQLITDYESYEENKNIIKFILPYINKNGKNISFDIFDELIQNSNNFEKTIEDFVKEYKYNFIGFGNIKDDNFLEDLKNVFKKIGYNEDLTIDIINGLFVNKSYIINDKEEKTIIVDKKINKYFTFKINSDDSSILDTSEEKSPNDNPIESFSGLQINNYDELEFKTKNNVILDINNLKHLLQIIKNKSNSEISKNKIDLLFSLLKELKSLKIKFKKSENNNDNFTGNYNVNDGIIIYLPADKNFNNNKLINVLFEETSHALLNNKKLNEDQKKEFAKKISVIKNKIIEFIQSAKYDNYIEKLSAKEKNSLFGPLYYSFTGQFINNENIKNLSKDLIIDAFKSSINDSTDSSDYLKNVEFLATSLNGNNIELIKFLNQIDKIEDKTIFETLVQEVKLLIQAILGDSKGKIIEDIYNELFWLINVKVSDNINKSTNSKISKTIQSKSQDDIDNVVKFLNSKLVSTDKTVSEDDNYEYDLDKIFGEKNKKSEQVGSVIDENIEVKKEETNPIEEKTDNTPNDNPLIIKSARRRNNTSNSYRPISENDKNYLLNNINTYFSIIDDLYGKQIINTITSHIVELFKDSDSKTIYDLLSDKISPNHIKDKLFKKFNDILYEIEKDEKRHNTIEDMFIQYMLQSSFPDENNNVADRTSFDQIMNYYFENAYNITVLNNNVVESDVLDNISNEENVINEDKFNKIEEKELTEQKIYDDKVNVDPYNESSPFVKRLLTIVSKNKNNNAYGVKDLSNPKELFGIIINKLENIVNYNEFYQEIKKLAESKDALYFYKDLFNYLKLFEDEKFIKDYPEEAYNFKRQIEVSFLDRAKLPLQALIETTFENKPTIRYFVNETSTNLSFLNDRIENALQNEFIKKNENEKFNFVENLKDDDYYNFMESFGFVKTKNEFINIWNSTYKNQKGSVIIKDFYKQLYKNKDNIVNNIKRNNVLIIVNYLKSENKSLAASFIKLLELSAIKSEETSDVNTFSITGDQVYEMSQYGNILNKLKDLKNFLINNPESNILSSLKNLPNHLQRYNPKYNPYINSSLLIKKINNLSAVILNGYKINDEPILLTDMDNNQWWNFQVFNLLSRGFVELMRAETKKTSLSLINNNSNNMILDVDTNNIDLGRTSYYIKELENEFFDYLKNNFKSFIESLYYDNNGIKLNVERINNNTIGNSIFSYLNEWKFDYNNEELTLKEILLLNNSDEGFNNLMNMLKNSDNIFEKNKERILNEHRKYIGNVNSIIPGENTLFKKLSESDTFDFLRKADYSESSILNTLLNQLKENKINYNEFKNLVTNITYYNWVVLNIEQLTLFTGELSSFSNLHKRLGLDVSTGTYLSINDDVQKFHTKDFINTTAVNTLSQIDENTLLENIKNIDTTIVKSSVISEVKQSSSLFGGINIDDTIFKHTLLYKGLQKSLNAKNIKIEDSILFEQFKGYGKNTIGDGQGYIDFDMYRRVMMDTGEWFNIPDNNRPLGYEYIKAKERLLRPTFNYDKYNKYLNINKTASESKEEDIKFVKNIEEKLNKKEIYFDFPPLKLGAKGEVIKDGKLVLLGDKLSVFPLIYDEKTIGTPQEQMIDEFRKNGIGYVKMKSGTKIDLYNELGEVNFDVISNPDDNYKLTDSTIHNIPSRFIKRQLATPSKIKKETIFGTQFRALLTAFQYNEGKFVNPHLEKPLTDYENSLLELTNYHTQKLFKKFGITDNGVFESLDVNLLYKELKSIDEEENNFEFEGVGKFNVDFKKAREIFIKSIENRGLSDNLNGLFEIVDGKFKYNLEATTSKKVIENLIRGLVNRDIIRQKSNGGMPVLVSSLFTGKKENSKLFNDWKNKLISSLDKSSDEAQELFRKIAMLGTEGLAFYRTIERNGEIKVLPAECKKTFSGDFKNLLNLSIPKDIQNLINKELINLNFNTIGFENYKIGNLNNLNVILNLMKNIRINRKEFYNEDLYKWYEENLQKGVLITSYRIPTQTYNSMEVFEIIEFLPEYYGDILIPPMEIVVKSGSDYDIDKLPTLNPNISIQGIVYDSNLLKYIEDKNLTKDYFKILEEQKSFIKDIKKEIKDNSEKLIELVKEHYLLSTPHIELSPENKILKDNELLKYKTINFKSGGKLKTLEDLSELTNTDETAIDNRISYLEEEIEKIKNEIKDIKEVKKEIYDYVDEYSKYIYAKKFNYKLYQNDIINNSIKILLDISNYYELLLPNSTSNIDKEDLIYNVLKSKNGKNFADQTKGIKGFNAILPQTQNLKFITMFGAMKLLGVFAVNNKFLPIIQKSNLPLKKYSNFLSTSDKPIAFDKNESGVLKSLILSEFINLSVDAPSDDKLGFLNLNMDNIGFFVFNLLNNVDPETMYHYIEQPVIKSFEKMLKKEMEEGKKNSYQDLYKNLIINLGINFKIPGTDTFIDGLELNEKNIPRYNKENFKLYLEFIVKYYSNNFKTLKDKNNNSYIDFKDLIHKYGNYKDNYSNSNINLLIIAFYYLQKTHAKNYRETISMMQPDTQGVYSSDSSNKKQDFLITKDSEIVDSEGIENIINNSVISSFFKHNIFLGLSKLFFPISHDISILNNRKLFYEDVFLYKTDKNGDYILDKRGKLIPLIKNNTYGEKLESALNLWNNDFIAYLTQNYIINDEKLGKKAERLIKIEDNIDENKQFIFKFKNIIDTLIKSGHTNIILSTIIDSIVKYNMSKNNNNDLNKYHNIYFKNIKDNDILKNQFLYSLKELYDKEQLFQSSGIKNIKEIIEELALALFYQSGLNKSIISFTDIIPIEILSPIIQKALNDFKYLDQDNKKILINDFNIIFAKLNPQFFKTYRQIDFYSGKWESGFNPESYRGKNYTTNINIDKLKKSSDINLLIQSINDNFVNFDKELLIKLNLKEC